MEHEIGLTWAHRRSPPLSDPTCVWMRKSLMLIHGQFVTSEKFFGCRFGQCLPSGEFYVENLVRLKPPFLVINLAEAKLNMLEPS
jgi:hypothetical protein